MLFEPTSTSPTLAPGARVLIRDAEWLVRKVDATSNGAQALTVLGLSELVRDHEAIFLTDLEPDLQILRPEDTEFVADESPRYGHALLYLESRLRQMPPTTEGLESTLRVGHRAAMDALPYQLEPALLALDQPRQRILIADTVGLGKTLEAGILLSELIARGRGKRILVVTVKSMMTQFQKELWSRFTIPLVRLDSLGLAKVRDHLPTNQNPFYYYDKAIVSIDTLKQNREYRAYLETAYWDVIVIDEAHHVAERGGGRRLGLKARAKSSEPVLAKDGNSQRNRLAKLLATRSDTLVMLSATPHDGRAKSFASLMNMLDPTAIANPEQYAPEDIKGLFIRRFKHDVADQVALAFKKRRMAYARAVATPAEEAAFDALVGLQATLPRQAGDAFLFGTLLEKALFSSPAACRMTIRNRLKRLEASPPDDPKELEGLLALDAELEAITPTKFAKFGCLVALIRDQLQWSGQDPADRLVVFTERIETLNFLAAELPAALGLAPNQVQTLHGGMSDTEQQERVEAFGQRRQAVRLLIASDVASEGINLHFLCHRMVHFDVPWSLMVFQQRNGRIDRYGQLQEPEIYYLLTESQNAKVKGDTRILELLTQKDDQAAANIGDPSALMGVYDVAGEEAMTADAIANGLSPEAFEATFEDIDPLALLMGTAAAPAGGRPQDRVRPVPSLFASDRAYALAALRALAERDRHLDVRETGDGLSFTMPEDLRDRFEQGPKEVNPHPKPLVLTDDSRAMAQAIEAARASERAWPEVQFLWPLHPAMVWLDDRLAALFERPRTSHQDAPRHRAPVLRLPAGLTPDEAVVLVAGVLPNRKGHPLIQTWIGVVLRPGQPPRIEELAGLVARTGLGHAPIANQDGPLDPTEAKRFQGLLPEAIAAARAHFADLRREFDAQTDGKLAAQLAALERLQIRKVEQLQLILPGLKLTAEKREERRLDEERRIADVFTAHRRWVEDTLRTGVDPSLQVMALLVARSPR